MIKWHLNKNGQRLDCFLLKNTEALSSYTAQGSTLDLKKLKKITGINFSLIDYLSQQLPGNIEQMYLLVLYNGELLGCASVQLVNFDFNSYINQSLVNRSKFSDRIFKQGLLRLGKLFNGKILVLGNLLLTGVRVDWIEPEWETLSENRWWEEIMDSLLDASDFDSGDFSGMAILSKGEEGLETGDKTPGWQHFAIEPVMHIRGMNRWKDIDAYYHDLRSRYRKKINQVLAGSQSLRVEKFNREDIIGHQARIMELFTEILNSSSYNLLHPEFNFFSELQEIDELDYHLCGVFDDEELVAFYSWFNYNNTTEGHYLGYEKSKNQEYDLYKFILLKLVEQAIQNNSDKLYLGRTATIVKADLGAEALTSLVSVKLFSKIRSLLLPIYYNAFYRSQRIKSRNVFKSVS